MSEGRIWRYLFKKSGRQREILASSNFVECSSRLQRLWENISTDTQTYKRGPLVLCGFFFNPFSSVYQSRENNVLVGFYCSDYDLF